MTGWSVEDPASGIRHRAAPTTIRFGSSRRIMITLVLIAAIPVVGAAQEIEPRTYANTPVGLNYLAFGYSYSTGNVFMDPSLPIEDVDARVNLILPRYIRTFNLFGSPAKIKALVPWSSGHWEGFLEDEFRTRDVSGFGDARLGLDVLLVGAPVLERSEFAAYEQKSVVGLRFDLVIPTGVYDPSKLINLGSNRWAVHGEVGLSKTFGRWTVEAAGGAWFYSDNDDFFGGMELSQDRFLVAKVNVVRSIRPGFWWAVGMGYGQGGRTLVDGVPRNTTQKNWRITAIAAFPISKNQGLSVSLISGKTFQAGPDFDVIAVAYQFGWGGS